MLDENLPSMIQRKTYFHPSAGLTTMTSLPSEDLYRETEAQLDVLLHTTRLRRRADLLSAPS